MRYPKTTRDGKTVYQHRVLAESAFGGPLPPKAVVHHAATTLVICQDQAYHMLLHERMRALAGGGDPNTERVCSQCKQLTPIGEMSLSMCPSCKRVYMRASVQKSRAKAKAA
jgi:hypothetical protein